ncbi:MAG: DUF790 family protein [Gemmatimonadaceae bacterium]
MLHRSQVSPFVHVDGADLRVTLLHDTSGVIPFLDRLCRLVRRLQGRPRRAVTEALRRQERRVRDAQRLAGISQTLLDLCDFRPPPGAGQSAAIRDAVFAARGLHWPPVPGDRTLPYELAGNALGVAAAKVERMLFADAPHATILMQAPELDGKELLNRYNLELARGVLLDATEATVTARGGWRGIFRAVKLARLMYRIERDGRRYRVELTGPASPYIVRVQRYGVRFARVVPALVRAPGWRLDAQVVHNGASVNYHLDAHTGLAVRARRAAYDSGWERALARDFSARMRSGHADWTLSREVTPLASGGELFLPDFTLRHRDGREALVEIVGFWTPDYLERKLRKVAAAGLTQLILVVYKGLAVGTEDGSNAVSVGAGPTLWFTDRPRIGEVLEAAEAVAVRPRG